jgi:ParB family chromosome partitioning protein
MLQTIPLNKLDISPENVRKTEREADIDALAANIAAVGLRQNLNVKPAPKGRFLVTAGGRRLRALKALAKTKKIKASEPIPCMVMEDGEDAAEISLAENVHRVAMHPMDQFEAFAALIDAGKDVADVAQRFGCGVRLVHQRLKLGRLSPRIREAFREGEIDLDAAGAFTLADDHADQDRVFDHCKATPSWDGPFRPSRIKQLLTETTLPATHKLVVFVGLDAYRDAGGPIREDLFSEVVYVEDRALAERLAMEKLEEAATALRAEGWKWAEVGLDRAAFNGAFGRVHPATNALSAEDAADIERLENRLYDLEREDEADTDTHAEWSRIEARLEAIEDKRQLYRPEDMARAGCSVMIDGAGELWIDKGLVRPEDTAATKNDGADPDSTEGGDKTLETGAIGKTAAKGYSQVLTDDLAAYRLQVVQVSLAERFDVAFDLIVFTMARSILHLDRADCLNASFHQTHERAETSLKDTSDTRAAAALKKAEDKLAKSWLMLEPERQFGAFRTLPLEDKETLFAYCTARMLQAQLSNEAGASTLFEEVGTILGADVAASWRPTRDSFWSRITKDQIAGIAGDTLGWQQGAAFRKEKKATLAQVMHQHFNRTEGGSGISEEQIAKVDRWLPDGMAFGRPDDDDKLSNG